MKIICLYRLVDTGQQLQHLPDPISKLAFAQETHKADVQKCWGWSPHLTTGIVAQVTVHGGFHEYMLSKASVYCTTTTSRALGPIMPDNLVCGQVISPLKFAKRAPALPSSQARHWWQAFLWASQVQALQIHHRGGSRPPQAWHRPSQGGKAKTHSLDFQTAFGNNQKYPKKII